MQSWKACYYLWWVLLPLVVPEALGGMPDAARIGTEIGGDTGREEIGTCTDTGREEFEMGSDTGGEGVGMGSDTGREETTARAGLPEALAEEARTEPEALVDEACTEPEDNGADAEVVSRR